MSLKPETTKISKETIVNRSTILVQIKNSYRTAKTQKTKTKPYKCYYIKLKSHIDTGCIIFQKYETLLLLVNYPVCGT